MVRRPYYIARQEHLGHVLDELAKQGRLEWRWAYDGLNSRAIFNVRRRNEDWRALDTRRAEVLAQAECDAMGIRWRPVPHPGGETQRAEIMTWIERGDESTSEG